jgi:CHAD domain-containing protein
MSGDTVGRRVDRAIIIDRLGQLFKALEETLSILAQRQTPGVVHDARIAVRRLQAALRNLRHQLPAHERKACMVALSAIVKECSAVRDADVRSRLVRHWLTRTGLKDHEQARLLHQTAERDRTNARRELRLRIHAPRWDKRLWKLRQNALALVRSQGKGFPVALIENARGRYQRPMRHMPKAIRTRKELHRFRLRIKDARYFLENFGPLFGQLRAGESMQLRVLQKTLGDLHDEWQLRQWLRRQYRCYVVTGAMHIQLKAHKTQLLKRIRHARDLPGA